MVIIDSLQEKKMALLQTTYNTDGGANIHQTRSDNLSQSGGVVALSLHVYECAWTY